MKSTAFAIEQLVPYVTGDGARPYRKGSVLVKLFNKYGARDKYDFDDGGFPQISLFVMNISKDISEKVQDQDGLSQLGIHQTRMLYQWEIESL